MDNRKCNQCGKVFKSVANLETHKRRKTPCFTREIKPEDIDNPLRCKFCNKIYSKNSNLVRHLATCRIKINGLNKPDINRDQETNIKLLINRDRENEQLINKMGNEIELLRNELEEIKKNSNALAVANPQNIEGNANITTNASNGANVTNNTNNNTNNINQTNHFTFCNFDAPNVDKIKLTQEDMLCENISRMMAEKIYFNKSLPENHVIFVPNVKEKRLLVYKDGIWENHVHDSVQGVLETIQDVIHQTTYKKIDNGGDLYDTDQQFEQLMPGVKHNIRQYFMRDPGHKMTQDQVLDLLVQKRNVVKNALQDNKK